MNYKYYQLKLCTLFLKETQKIRQDLISELATLASDSVLFKRRFRMLQHLSSYESQAIEKISKFESTDPNDYNLHVLVADLNWVTHRSA